jgi:O-antigen ligase
MTAPADAIASERYVRVGYWLTAIDVSAAHPLGVGTGNFAFYYPHYASISPEYEFYARITDAHNWFLEAYAETGILGGSAFLAFTLTLVAAGISAGRRMATDEWGPSLTALTVAFVIFCLMHLTYSFFYYPFEWVVAGLIAARVAAARREAPSAARASG